MDQQAVCNSKDRSWSFIDSADQANLHLHVEIENLKQKLLEREHHIVTMETYCLNEAEKFPNGELAALTEELLTWQEKYSRLYESHKRIQKVNQNLEDKLLRIVDKCETEKSCLSQEMNCLTQTLYEARCEILQLKEENERYRNDINLAIQLLQCKPSNFVSQRYESLPVDLQQKVRLYVSSKRRPSNGNITQPKPEIKTIKVPIPTFPPTAMVYSVNKESAEKDESNDEEKSPVDIISAAIMAKVLEERERERLQMKHCSSCTCPQQINGSKSCNKETQTVESQFASQKMIIDSSNRGSQGLVRYVDVMASRGGERRQGTNTMLGLNSQVSKIKISNMTNGVSLVRDINGALESPVKSENNYSVVSENVLRVDETIKEEENKNLRNTLKSSYLGNGGLKYKILENEGLKKNDNLKSIYGDKLSHEKILLCLNKTSVDTPVRPANREGRTFLSDIAASDNNGDLSHESRDQDTPTERRKLVDGKIKTKERPLNDMSGPRPCSLRLQAGTSNILLDNATSYEPILYTCRPSKKDKKSSRKVENSTASVHTSRSRSASSSSSCETGNPAETEI